MSSIIVAPPKKCPRCKGRMIEEEDAYGAFATCFICGYVHETERPDPDDLLEEEREALVKQRRRQPSHDKLRL